MFPLLFICVFVNGAAATLNLKEVPIEKRELFVPPLQEIAEVLNSGLKKHYKEVKVDVVDCPDLREQPFGLADVGLYGKTRIVEIGGVQYLLPVVNHSKSYDIRDVVEVVELDSALVFGASGCPFEYAGTSCEGIFNAKIMGDKTIQHSTIIEVKDDGSYKVTRLPDNETRSDILIDLFVTEGKPGPVLEVHVSNRIVDDAFPVSIRNVLAEHYGSNIVGLGGTFILKRGTALQTLLPQYPKTPMRTFDDVLRWVKPYNMSTPLTAVGMIITGKLDLDLRLQHFHSFSERGEGGHFVTDITPKEAEYHGYFTTAEYLYRIDKPPVEIARKDD